MKRKSKSIVTMIVILAIALFSYLNQDKPVDQVSENTENSISETTDESTVKVEVASETNVSGDSKLDEQSPYYEAEEVALYIHTYGKLPVNYLTKGEANDLGWDSDQGNLWDVTDKMVIGGDRFGNREGLLPNKASRIWYECDVNYEGGFRNGERLVFSNDGLIYYTGDHYTSFEKWYE